MNWYLRAIQKPDGCWVCSFGNQEFGTLPDLPLALHHMVGAATQLGGRDFFSFHLHYLDGRFEVRPATDPVPAEVADEAMDHSAAHRPF